MFEWFDLIEEADPIALIPARYARLPTPSPDPFPEWEGEERRATGSVARARPADASWKSSRRREVKERDFPNSSQRFSQSASVLFRS